MRQSVAVQRGLNYRVFSTPPSLHVRPPLRAGIVCFVPRRGVLGACQNLVSQSRRSRCRCKCQSIPDSQQSQDPQSPDSRSRRTLQVTFTCDKCGSRTERLVNPHAWETGLVYLQCEGCKVWHQLKDNQKIIEEVHLRDPV